MSPSPPSPPNYSRIRPAAVAGRFYPAEPNELRRLISDFLAACPPASSPAPKAVIAPHAGYIYSGPIAASAYSLLAPAREHTKRIVLVGPSHFAVFDGLAASSMDAFETPLGLVPLDTPAMQALTRLPHVRMLDEAHEREHALEVQLPFLQTVLGEFTLVPLLVGDAAPEQIAAALDLLWNDPQTRFVISSDLSHYLNSDQARRVDQQTANAIEEMESGLISEHQACGRLPIQGLLRTAAEHHLRARVVDLRNSGDTSGPRHQVVGYGAFAFEEPQSASA